MKMLDKGGEGPAACHSSKQQALLRAENQRSFSPVHSAVF